MKIKYLIPLIILFTLAGCNQKKESYVKTAGETARTSLTPGAGKKDSLVFGNDIHDYILFGMFCGECGSHCATMFLYNMGGNSNTLFADYTDSYFNNNGKIICNTAITDIKKFQLANSIIEKIPPQLLITTESHERFGCPDCTDGCGIYFEFGLAGKVKKFAIDTETSKLTADMKAFSEFLQHLIGEMRK